MNASRRKNSGRICTRCFSLVHIGAYLLARSTSSPVGALLGGCCGCAGAAPVVMPGSVLLRGVTSRIPAGAAGLFCAVLWAAGAVAVDPVPAGFIEVLLSP